MLIDYILVAVDKTEAFVVMMLVLEGLFWLL